MRLPMQRGVYQRIGHFSRRVPEGYLETIATGENRIHHPGLRRYYEALRQVIRAPVFDGDRLRTTWALLRGEYDADLAAYVAEDHHTPPRLRVPAAELERSVHPGTWWFDDPGVRCVYLGGLEVAFPAPVTARTVRVLLQSEMSYTFRFCREGKELGSATADLRQLSFPMGLQEFLLTVPPEATPYDTIRVDAVMDCEHVAAIAVLSPRE
jgi:arabinofuranosyltransferase